MSSPGSPLLEIERSARSQSIVVWGVLTILAVVPYVLVSLPSAAAAAFSMLLTTCGAIGFWRIGWLWGERAVHKALWTSEGQWCVTDLRGRSWPATLASSSRVMGGLLWLRFDGDCGPRELLLVGADLPQHLQRRLVARLRLQAGARQLTHADSSDLPS